MKDNINKVALKLTTLTDKLVSFVNAKKGGSPLSKKVIVGAVALLAVFIIITAISLTPNPKKKMTEDEMLSTVLGYDVVEARKRREKIDEDVEKNRQIAIANEAEVQKISDERKAKRDAIQKKRNEVLEEKKRKAFERMNGN